MYSYKDSKKTSNIHESCQWKPVLIAVLFYFSLESLSLRLCVKVKNIVFVNSEPKSLGFHDSWIVLIILGQNLQI